MTARLIDIANYCIKDCTAAKEAAEIFTKDHFLRCIPMNISSWARGQNPAMLKEAGTLCDKFIGDRNMNRQVLRRMKTRSAIPQIWHTG